MKKHKIIAGTGVFSTILGSAGAIIAGLGLCGCMFAPIFAFAGTISLIMVFLSEYRYYFLTIGIISLLISLYFYKNKKECKIKK